MFQRSIYTYYFFFSFLSHNCVTKNLNIMMKPSSQLKNVFSFFWIWCTCRNKSMKFVFHKANIPKCTKNLCVDWEKKLFTGFLGYIFFFVSLEKVSLNSHWQCCVYVSLKTSSGGIFFHIFDGKTHSKNYNCLKD